MRYDRCNSQFLTFIYKNKFKENKLIYTFIYTKLYRIWWEIFKIMLKSKHKPEFVTVWDIAEIFSETLDELYVNGVPHWKSYKLKPCN